MADPRNTHLYCGSRINSARGTGVRTGWACGAGSCTISPARAGVQVSGLHLNPHRAVSLAPDPFPDQSWRLGDWLHRLLENLPAMLQNRIGLRRGRRLMTGIVSDYGGQDDCHERESDDPFQDAGTLGRLVEGPAQDFGAFWLEQFTPRVWRELAIESRPCRSVLWVKSHGIQMTDRLFCDSL
jgi:hypothetical protein